MSLLLYSFAPQAITKAGDRILWGYPNWKFDSSLGHCSIIYKEGRTRIMSNAFVQVVGELRDITTHANMITSPSYYWMIGEDGIRGISIDGHSINIALDPSIRDEWVSKLNAATKEAHQGPLFTRVGQEYKISMIQEIRASHGFGLKDAKEFVEDYLDNGGNGTTLPFILYTGVNALEGLGYFPFKETQPYPIEMAEVLGYTIAKEKQEVVPAGRWGVYLSYGEYKIAADFNDEVSLGWDGENVIRVGDTYRDYVYLCSHKAEAQSVAGLMTEAHRTGYNTAMEKIRGLCHDLYIYL